MGVKVTFPFREVGKWLSVCSDVAGESTNVFMLHQTSGMVAKSLEVNQQCGSTIMAHGMEI